jgi:hypothetical protein
MQQRACFIPSVATHGPRPAVPHDETVGDRSVHATNRSDRTAGSEQTAGLPFPATRRGVRNRQRLLHGSGLSEQRRRRSVCHPPASVRFARHSPSGNTTASGTDSASASDASFGARSIWPDGAIIADRTAGGRAIVRLAMRPLSTA